MKSIKKFVLNNKFLALVLLAYAITFGIDASVGLSMLKNSLHYVKEMLIIMPVILLLTALLEAWVPKKTIEKHLGGDSGIKGQIFAFLLGSFSAGPIYAAFPVCIALLKKGASIANIVILLSTWAVIKIPMLANEAKFLSPQFMIYRWILTTIAIFLMGNITAKIVSRKEVLALHPLPEQKMGGGTKIIADYCIGCGVCVGICPACFTMKNGKAIVTDNGTGQKELIAQAVDRCPAHAIEML